MTNTPEPSITALLLDHLAARACVLDRDGRCVHVNREWSIAYRCPPARVVGRSPLDVFGDTDRLRHAAPIAGSLAGEPVSIEGWVDEADGRRYLEETFVPHRSDDGAVAGVAIVARDRTELKLREQELAGRLAELKTSEALKSAIVDHALVALISTDADGCIVEFNPSAEAMFGLARDAAIGRRVSDAVIPERFRAPHEAGMERMQRGCPSRVLGKRLEMHAMRADGSEFPIEMVLWRTTVGGTAFYTASIVDVTERQDAAREIERQRESLRQTEKLGAMGSLLAGVAHELNNPLAIVMGRAGLLEERCTGGETLDREQLAGDARRIREAADRCGRIVRTFLDMARRRPAQRSAVALNDLVRAAVDMLQYGYRTHGIALDVVLCEGLPMVEADADQIGQIVMNLLVNAQQVLAGAAEPRQVRIETGLAGGAAAGRAGSGVWLRVADSGPGVDPSLRARVFEPFFTTKPEGSGTGLGLSLSRSMARDHGGDLVLEDATEAQGARFRLDLPIASRVAGEPVVAAGPPAESDAGRRILVVDDEPDLAALMRDLLESAGYTVATAGSGAVALRLLDTVPFDAIVSDLRMPDVDGAALWRAVSATDPALARRMLFVTGDTLSPDAQRFLAGAGCEALDKPFVKADLLAGVARLLGRGQATTSMRAAAARAPSSIVPLMTP